MPTTLRLRIAHADLGALNDAYPVPSDPYAIQIPNVDGVVLDADNNRRHYLDETAAIIATVPEDIIVETQTLP